MIRRVRFASVFAPVFASVFVLVLLMSNTGLAQNSPAEKIIAIRAATLIDGVSNQARHVGFVMNDGSVFKQ